MDPWCPVRQWEFMVSGAGGRELREMVQMFFLFVCKWESIVGEFMVWRSFPLLPVLV